MRINKSSGFSILITSSIILISCIQNEEPKKIYPKIGNFSPLNFGNKWIFMGGNASSSFSVSESFSSIRSVEIISETNNSDTVIYEFQIRDSLFMRIFQLTMDTPVVVYSRSVITRFPDSTILIDESDMNFEFELISNGFNNNLFDSSLITTDTVNNIPTPVIKISDALQSGQAMSVIQRERYFIKDIGIGYIRMNQSYRNGSRSSWFKLISFNNDSTIFNYP